MKNQTKITLLITWLLTIFMVVACTPSSGSEPDAEGMEQMEHDEDMEGMDHDEGMAHDDMAHDDGAEHTHNDDKERITNDGATIEILSPNTGDSFPFAEPILIEVDVENFELDNEGSHWHIYIDGASYGMVMGNNLDQPVVGLEPGQHRIEVFLANGDHEELMDGDGIMIIVEEDD